MKKPQPKSVNIVCSVCGLAWDRHKSEKDKEPTLESCVALLKEELAKRPLPQIWNPVTTFPNISYYPKAIT
jgi:hypothetical protein